ncbi:MAG: HPr family phosphocarrier protein [Clostridiales bacterium]|nr:HPr family phosphocarrier protein [Clostridiales bacterium]
MKELKHVIKDELGIHARPAGMLVKLLSAFSGEVQVGNANKMIDGKRLFALLGLGLKQGDEMILRFEGEGEEEAFTAVASFLAENL